MDGPLAAAAGVRFRLLQRQLEEIAWNPLFKTAGRRDANQVARVAKPCV